MIINSGTSNDACTSTMKHSIIINSGTSNDACTSTMKHST
jgi:hypothetical protein